MSTTVIFLTAPLGDDGLGVWIVPTYWNNVSNSIECISAGGAGSHLGGGGGAGGYSRAVNVALTPGQALTYQVGDARSQANHGLFDTWIGGVDVTTSICGIDGGFPTFTATGGVAGGLFYGHGFGGVGGSQLVNAPYSYPGGAGGTGGNSGAFGGGGGGAGGPNGTGVTGANDAGGVAGVGGAGDAGFGGAGGGVGVNGSPGTEWTYRTVIAGAGGGGGGTAIGSGTVGNGAIYGGGGGGGSAGDSLAGQGIIVIITSNIYTFTQTGAHIVRPRRMVGY